MDPIMIKKIVIFSVALIVLVATLVFAGATYELEEGERRGRKPAKWMYIYCPVYLFTMVGWAMYFFFKIL